MSSLISGVVLEGLSTAGKTSVLKSIKQVQSLDTEAERSVVILGEHYSQQLQVIHGKEVSLSVSAHTKLLKERIEGIETLNSWAKELGPHRKSSRGLFYLFERFHLNHRMSYPTSGSIGEIEERLIKLNCKCVILTVSVNFIESRLAHRSNGLLFGTDLRDAAAGWMEKQERLLECARLSNVPYIKLRTDGMEWQDYATKIMEFCVNSFVPNETLECR